MAAITYYLDGSTLADSTVVYTDEEMSICASDGFYSDGIIVRELSGCILLPAQPCPSCLIPCSSDGEVSLIGSKGIYSMDVNIGNNVGAVVIEFEPIGAPNGIKATYLGAAFNQVSSQTDGLHEPSTPGGFVFIGDVANDCGISGNTYLGNIEYEYSFVSGVFQDTGSTGTINAYVGDVSLTAGPTGRCMMVVPKTTTTSGTTILSLEILGPCNTNNFKIKVICPRLLTGFSSSIVKATKELACGTDPSITLYSVPVNGVSGIPGLYDWIFQDNYGQVIVADGFYNLGGNTIEVVSGIVVGLGTC